MNEQEAVQRVREVLNAGLNAGQFDREISVRTEGGGEYIEFPMVIIAWSTDRIDRLQGNTPYAGVVRDSNGNATARKLHAYYNMRIDLWAKTYDDEPSRQRTNDSLGEVGRDRIVDEMSKIFVPFEYDSDAFHEDAFEFQSEDVNARSDPEQEPNWFEADQTVTFRYMKEIVDSSPEALAASDTDITYEVTDE